MLLAEAFKRVVTTGLVNSSGATEAASMVLKKLSLGEGFLSFSMAAIVGESWPLLKPSTGGGGQWVFQCSRAGKVDLAAEPYRCNASMHVLASSRERFNTTLGNSIAAAMPSS